MKGKTENSGTTQAIHDDLIRKVSAEMPEENILYDLAELFKIFGDSTRIKILYALFSSEMCVCDISHQLRILKQARLVKFRKVGKIVYYSLNDDHIQKIFEQGLSHVTE